MKVILTQQEVIDAVAEWLSKRGITAKHVDFRFIETNGNKYVPELETTVAIEKVEVKEGPYR